MKAWQKTAEHKKEDVRDSLICRGSLIDCETTILSDEPICARRRSRCLPRVRVCEPKSNDVLPRILCPENSHSPSYAHGNGLLSLPHRELLGGVRPHFCQIVTFK